MISRIKKEIEDFSQEVYLNNLLFKKTRNGLVSQEDLGAYVFNVKFLIENTIPHVALGYELAQAQGMKGLSDFFKTKLGEEVGHEVWAQNDLNYMKFFSPENKFHLSAHVLGLEKFIRESLMANPVSYCMYATWAEYFTVLITDTWAQDLENHCQLSRECISILTKHAVVDKDHVAEDLRVLGLLIEEQLQGDEQNLFDFLNKVKAYYWSFAEEIANKVLIKETAHVEPQLASL